MDPTLDQFLDYVSTLPDIRGRAWIEEPAYHFRGYVRLSQHAFSMGDKYLKVNTFDLANFNIEDEFQNQGFFTKFLYDEVLANPRLNDYSIFVENILTKELWGYFDRRFDEGWRDVTPPDLRGLYRDYVLVRPTSIEREENLYA